MTETSIDRLRAFLAQLPQGSRSLLMNEYERALQSGEDSTVASFVLEELRQIMRKPSVPARATSDLEEIRKNAAIRQLFDCLKPFLVDEGTPVRLGQIRRASLLPIWIWLENEGAPEAVAQYSAHFRGDYAQVPPGELERAARKLQRDVAEILIKLAAPGPGGARNRMLARVGPIHAGEDLGPIGQIFKARDHLDSFGVKIPAIIRVFDAPQLASVEAALDNPVLVTPQLLPYTLSLVIARLVAPWQIVRIATAVVGSDDELRLASSPFGVAVSLAIHDLAALAATLRYDIKRSKFDSFSERLKLVHDGIRGVRTELDTRNDSKWGKQLAAVRVEVSNALQSEIDSVPGRVRRILRQRTEKDMASSMRLEPKEVEEIAALIGFVATCRNFAGELAINEVTLRTYSELQFFVETSTESLVQSLKASEGRVRDFRILQVRAAIKFCQILFGAEYAALMERATESAMLAERKPPKVS